MMYIDPKAEHYIHVIKYDEEKLIKYIEQNEINFNCIYRNRLLRTICYRKHINLNNIKRLIEIVPSDYLISGIPGYPRSPLSIAIINNKLEIVKLFLSKIPEQKLNLIFFREACDVKNIEILKFLLKKISKEYLQENMHYLYVICINGNIEMLKLVINKMKVISEELGLQLVTKKLS